jgi:hypothetical protein
MSLHSLIYRVRDKLNSLPQVYCSDEQIYQDIIDANDFILPKVDQSISVDDDRVISATVALATYFTYLNYLSLATLQFNNVPVLATVKLNSYREIALALIRDITNVRILDNLSVDVDYYSKLRPSVTILSGSGLSE